MKSKRSGAGREPSRWVKHALVAGGLLLTAGTALAQDPPSTCSPPLDGHLAYCLDIIGPEICFHAPKAVPPVQTMRGLPKWPGLVLPPGHPEAGTAARPEVSDPRWGNAPLRRPPTSAGTDNALYRILVDNPDDPSELAVSIQVRADNRSPGGEESYVFFGITNSAQTEAWGVKIAAFAGRNSDLSEITGRALEVWESGVDSYHYSLAVNSDTNWEKDPGFPSNGWVTRATSALWNSPADVGQNGASYAVQFRVRLDVLGLGEGDTPRVMIGAVNDFSDSGVPGFVEYSTPNMDTCASCRGADEVGPFHRYISEWAPVAPLGDPCTGISIDSTGIFTGRGRYVSVASNAINVLKAKPGNIPSDIREEELFAEFHMSNWGTVATPAAWIRLPHPDAALTPGKPEIDAECTNGPNFGGVCNRNIETRCDIVNDVPQCDEKFHQCLMVELGAGQGAEDHVRFENASAYNNTRFVPLSSREQYAEINVKGLQALLKNANPRDVYLHVVPMNMPEAGNTRLPDLNVAALEALRAQVDSGFQAEIGCENTEETCVNGTCAFPCFAGEFGPCFGQGTPTQTANGCFCIPTQNAESCRNLPNVAPAGGGVNPNVSALNGQQKLREQYPNLEIFPYYDSGETVMVRGQARKRLVAMPTFSVMMTHSGALYGFLHRLLNSDGSEPAASGTNAPLGRLERVGDNFYRVRVPNEGTASIRVFTSAEEQPYYTPMLQIVGTATPLPLGLGNATFTGVIQSGRTVDLSKSTITINRLLAENGKELVGNLNGPITLTRLPGATPGLAVYAYSSFGRPTVTMQVATLPFLGHTFSFQVIGASVSKPAACGLFGGTATLVTEFSLNESGSRPMAVRGTDTWGCLPGQLLNL